MVNADNTAKTTFAAWWKMKLKNTLLLYQLEQLQLVQSLFSDQRAQNGPLHALTVTFQLKADELLIWKNLPSAGS